MHTPQSQEIVARFYEAVQYLVNNGELRSLRDFTERYDILYSNFHKAMTDHSRQVFQIAWLTPLIADFSISANWLMTGSGSMVFKSPPDSPRKLVPKPQEEGHICPSCANVVQE